MIGANKWVRIAYSRDIPLREGRAVQVGGREIAIFNLGDRFLAVENRCPHRGGPLADGIVSGTNVVCPLHAWKMSLETGQGVSGPSASSCVQTFHVRVEGGIVLLEWRDEKTAGPGIQAQDLPAICLQPDEIAAIADSPSSAEA